MVARYKERADIVIFNNAELFQFYLRFTLRYHLFCRTVVYRLCIQRFELNDPDTA